VVVAGLTWVVTTKAQYLASLYTTNITLQTQFAMLTDLALWAWGGTALAVLLARRRTILDLWLMVTLLAWMPNFLLALIANPLRFTIGWYAARCFVLIGSCMLRTVLLVETVFLYSRLTSAIILQRRERINSLLSVDAVTASLAHELNTPLAAIALNASTAISELHSSPLDLKELDEILKDIEAESHRAGAIISSVRQLSKKTTDRITSTRVEDVVRLVLRLLQHDLQISEVSVATQFQGDLPEVHIDGTQLQQVLLNFIKNAIDAMNAVAPEARRLLMTTSCDGHSSVSLSVQDSGPGIPVEDQDRLFDQFFTTKSDGMGLGLAICLTVVERHGGKLQLVKSDSDGSIFEIEIPVTGRNLG
jgi:signal transduction histidine kinase